MNEIKQKVWIYAQKMPDETWRFGMRIDDKHIDIKHIHINVPVRTRYADKSPHLYLECEGVVSIENDIAFINPL